MGLALPLPPLCDFLLLPLALVSNWKFEEGDVMFPEVTGPGTLFQIQGRMG